MRIAGVYAKLFPNFQNYHEIVFVSEYTTCGYTRKNMGSYNEHNFQTKYIYSQNLANFLPIFFQFDCFSKSESKIFRSWYYSNYLKTELIYLIL